jgi:hypothetical protein
MEHSKILLRLATLEAVKKNTNGKSEIHIERGHLEHTNTNA